MTTMIVVQCSFGFEAAHRLTGVPEDHKCSRMHGHSYEVTLSVRGELDHDSGMLVDFGTVKAAFEPLRKRLDHATLNDVPGLGNPTAEMLAVWIWDELLLPKVIDLVGVAVRETKRNAVLYYGPSTALTARAFG
jgi:6-pyruvoyltetrahydropterin/6-carboxytetrahydropterin synthase